MLFGDGVNSILRVVWWKVRFLVVVVIVVFWGGGGDKLLSARSAFQSPVCPSRRMNSAAGRRVMFVLFVT